MDTIGQRIKKVRLSLGLTQSEFGKEIALISNEPPISKGTVNNWEHDRNRPNKSRSISISALGNVSYDTFQKDEEHDLYRILDRYSKDSAHYNYLTEEIVKYYGMLKDIEDNEDDNDKMLYLLSSFMSYLEKVIHLKEHGDLNNDENYKVYEKILNNDFQRLLKNIFK